MASRRRCNVSWSLSTSTGNTSVMLCWCFYFKVKLPNVLSNSTHSDIVSKILGRVTKKLGIKLIETTLRIHGSRRTTSRNNININSARAVGKIIFIKHNLCPPLYVGSVGLNVYRYPKSPIKRPHGQRWPLAVNRDFAIKLNYSRFFFHRSIYQW